MEKAVKFGLGLAIAVIFPLMVFLGFEAFYPSPEYENCSRYLNEKISSGPEDYQEANKDYKSCYDAWKNENDIHNRNVFLVATVIGFGAIAAGTLFFGSSIGPIAPGLVFGGLFTIIYGDFKAFNSVDETWLFLELVLVLLGLIGVTMRFIKTTEKAKERSSNA